MRSRAEITTKYAKARKKDKGWVLDEVVAVTGWSRDNARRRLTAAAKAAPGSGRAVALRARRPRAELNLLRRAQGAAAGVGGLGQAVRQVPGCLDAHPARRAGAPR